MAEFLFSPRSHQWDDKPQVQLPGKNRLSNFLLAGLFVGLPALVWALRVLYGHYKSGGRISALVIMLLLCDLLELLLSPYVATKLLQEDYCWDSSWTCRLLTSLWSALVFYGLHLQQVVVLKATLSLRHPPCSAHVFFPDCSIITSIILFISFFLCEFFEATLLILLGLPVLLMITLTSCIVTCRAPPQTSSTPSRTRKPSSTVLVFATSALILYAAFTIVCIIMRNRWTLWVMYFSLMSLRVVLDPVLCVLVYRKDLKLQTPPTHAEHDELVVCIPCGAVLLSTVRSSSP
ncbi:hypothetical protein NFI96_021919 [Prochilodus magdalenae]|nr:hypothetical protein NFI96_021919 [Prochilodus magdalenae]